MISARQLAIGAAAAGGAFGIAALARDHSREIGTGGILLGTAATAIGISGKLGSRGAWLAGGIGALAGGIAAAALLGKQPSAPALPDVVLPETTKPGVSHDGGPGADHNPTWNKAGKDPSVGWWPEGMHVHPAGTYPGTPDTILMFESIVTNMGEQPVKVSPGDHLHYDVYRRNDDGSLGEEVGSADMPITSLDVQPFPPPFGEETGHPAESFGLDLKPVDHLDGFTAGILNAHVPGHMVDLGKAGDGNYVLRQTLVMADTADDVNLTDNVRDTGFLIHGNQAIQISSGYADTSDIGN